MYLVDGTWMIFSLGAENHIALESSPKAGFSAWPHFEAGGTGKIPPC